MNPVSTTLSQWLFYVMPRGSGTVLWLAVLGLAGLIVQQRRLRRRDRDDFELISRIVDGGQPDAPVMLKRIATIFKARRERRSRWWPW